VLAENPATGTRAFLPRISGSLGWGLNILGPFFGLILTTLLFAYLARDSGSFLTVLNCRTILLQTVIVATAALGMTLIMISGGIDLSVGSVVALVGVCMALLVKGVEIHLPAFLGGGGWTLQVSLASALALGILLGGLCGLLNGSLITGLGVVPFIITLGSLKVFRGLALWLSGENPVYVPRAAKPDWFEPLMQIEPEPAWLLMAPGFWVLVALAALVSLTLRFTVPGRYVYAIGSNELTARLCGINVRLMKTAIYGLAGLAVGLAGVFQFTLLGGVGDPTTANGLELQVIAAVVIGGASLSGGEGTVLGTLIGCLIMSVLQNGCVLAGIPPSSQDLIIGAIIVAAVTLDRFRRSRFER
jgi:ribose/xylose/arabinose/galactoside ABC-type transport system permease subunit